MNVISYCDHCSHRRFWRLPGRKVPRCLLCKRFMWIFKITDYRIARNGTVSAPKGWAR